MKCQINIFICLYSLICSCSGSNDLVIGTVDLGSSKIMLTEEADKLDVPWDLQYDKLNKCIIFSEISGNIKKLDLESRKITLLKKIPNVFQQRTTGLLGMALYQPRQGSNYLFLSFTTKQNDSIYSNLYRYIYTQDSKLEDPRQLLRIPGNTGHNGSRIIIGQDGKVYWATGDAASDHFAQDSTALNGKILRINTDGTIPADNPIPGSYVYSWGFRNIQGLAQGEIGLIYTAEHGDAIEDEVNLLYPLHNYGWPMMEGRYASKQNEGLSQKRNFTPPIRSWTPVIAPAGMAYYRGSKIPEWSNSLILTTLKSQSLHILKLSDDGHQIRDEYMLFKDQLGRLRSVLTAPNGDIYFCSSNRDWNPQKGFPKANDDKIYRLRKMDKVSGMLMKPVKKVPTVAAKTILSGKVLYESYCSSCHKSDGRGVLNTFPPLESSKTVRGDKKTLTALVLNGIQNKTIEGSKYDAAMPAFNFLKDEELASILNYIRINFNNQSSTITIDELKQYRKTN